MSRMVRESDNSGLRERLYFARSMLKQLTGEQATAVPGVRLALRGAVLFHLYSVLVGMARQAAKTYALPGYEQHLSLPGLEQAFAEAGIEAPEITLLRQARQDRGDLIAWLDQQVSAAMGAAGLARRPAPPGDSNALNVLAEDRYAPLAEGDLQRLADSCQRVAELVEHCMGYQEEW